MKRTYAGLERFIAVACLVFWAASVSGKVRVVDPFDAFSDETGRIAEMVAPLSARVIERLDHCAYEDTGMLWSERIRSMFRGYAEQHELPVKVIDEGSILIGKYTQSLDLFHTDQPITIILFKREDMEAFLSEHHEFLYEPDLPNPQVTGWLKVYYEDGSHDMASEYEVEAQNLDSPLILLELGRQSPASVAQRALYSFVGSPVRVEGEEPVKEVEKELEAILHEMGDDYARREWSSNRLLEFTVLRKVFGGLSDSLLPLFPRFRSENALAIYLTVDLLREHYSDVDYEALLLQRLDLRVRELESDTFKRKITSESLQLFYDYLELRSILALESDGEDPLGAEQRAASKEVAK